MGIRLGTRSIMSELKSLAHPDWPYTGTPHEWRGFAEKLAEVMAQPEPEFIRVSKAAADAFNAFYQKQNFGPELK
jgi:heme oxygenase